jgi:hypothetical protein
MDVRERRAAIGHEIAAEAAPTKHCHETNHQQKGPKQCVSFFY